MATLVMIPRSGASRPLMDVLSKLQYRGVEQDADLGHRVPAELHAFGVDGLEIALLDGFETRLVTQCLPAQAVAPPCRPHAAIEGRLEPVHCAVSVPGQSKVLGPAHVLFYPLV